MINSGLATGCRLRISKVKAKTEGLLVHVHYFTCPYTWLKWGPPKGSASLDEDQLKNMWPLRLLPCVKLDQLESRLLRSLTYAVHAEFARASSPVVTWLGRRSRDVRAISRCVAAIEAPAGADWIRTPAKTPEKL